MTLKEDVTFSTVWCFVLFFLQIHAFYFTAMQPCNVIMAQRLALGSNPGFGPGASLVGVRMSSPWPCGFPSG